MGSDYSCLPVYTEQKGTFVSRHVEGFLPLKVEERVLNRSMSDLHMIALVVLLLVIGLFDSFFFLGGSVSPRSSVTPSFTKQNLTAAPSGTADYLGVNLRGITLHLQPFQCTDLFM